MFEGNPGDIDFGSSQRSSSYLACVASVSVWFGAKKDRGTGFSVLPAREIKRDEPKNERGGRGRGRGRKEILLAPFFARLRSSFGPKPHGNARTQATR